MQDVCFLGHVGPFCLTLELRQWHRSYIWRNHIHPRMIRVLRYCITVGLTVAVGWGILFIQCKHIQLPMNGCFLNYGHFWPCWFLENNRLFTLSLVNLSTNNVQQRQNMHSRTIFVIFFFWTFHNFVVERTFWASFFKIKRHLNLTTAILTANTLCILNTHNVIEITIIKLWYIPFSFGVFFSTHHVSCFIPHWTLLCPW